MSRTDWQKKGEGHRQRLRDKFRERGLDAFTDSEVLELLLTLGTPRRDCKETARAALDRFGSLAAVLEAPQEELEEVAGLGANNTFALHLIHGVARRYLRERLRAKQYLRSSSEVAAYLTHALRDLDREAFLAIFLDAEHAIIDSEIVSLGTVTTNTIYPRELIKRALARNAAALVVAHNHPSGNLRPSAEDRRLTKSLMIACTLMNIRLLDHFIVGQGEAPFSFADQGLMATLGDECRDVF